MVPEHTFEGNTNTFRDIVARRVFITSDPREKSDRTPLSPRGATRTVRGLRPHRYTLDGQEAAGLLADEVPTAYVRQCGPGGPLVVDYQSLLAELWASVQHAHARLDALEQPGAPTTPSTTSASAAGSGTSTQSQ